MQLINSLEERSNSIDRLEVALEDIISNIQIKSDFSILHPDYHPWEFAADKVVCLQRLPAEIQQKYLNMQLRNFIYGVYYSGNIKAIALFGLPSSEYLENNAGGGLDPELYANLHESNCGQGYFDPGWDVLREESNGLLAVQKNELTIHVDRKQLRLAEQSVNIGSSISLPMPSNLVTKGCYLAVGNAGLCNYNSDTPQMVDIYFNFSPAGAIAVMKSLTQQLNAMNIMFSFRVPYNINDYNRYDSGILHIERHNSQAIWQVLQNIYTESKSHFQTDVPLFTKPLAPGIGLAEEPNAKFVASENFGANRCRMVANGLQSAWQQGDDSKEGKLACIIKHFSEMKVDLKYPYLNANQDIYPILN
jgi:HopA1 effector protein family